MVQALSSDQTGPASGDADLERQVIERSSERGTIWQVSPMLLSVIDMTDGRFSRVNPAWTATLGWAEEELAGAPYVDFVHPDDLAPSYAAFEEVRRGIPVLHFENRYRAKDGSFHWLAWVAVPENGKLYSTTRDVTQEKEQERLLAERTRERDRAWRLSQDLLVVVDTEGRLVSINDAWTRLLGWSETELVGFLAQDLVHPDDLGPTLQTFAGIRKAPLVSPYECRVRHQDGGYRWFAWTGSFEDGQVFASGRYTSPEHEQAEALARAEEALRQSQKMEAVGQLTGGLAHDFNNILAGLSGSLEMLQTRIEQGRFDAVDRYVNAGMGAIKRAAALTHRLLAFSRRQTLDPKAIGVNRLVSGMEDLIRRTMGPGIDVEVVGAGGLWNTLVDPNQLENALLNLCINARDAMPDGGRLRIETANVSLDAREAAEWELPPGPYVSLCVTDSGTGMAPDVIAKAFDPFFTTKPLGEGTGLGLSMIYGFARQSNGQVRISSAVGRGTAIYLYLPRHEGQADGENGAAAAAATHPSGAGEIVLVIDDEPIIRMLIADVLADLGYVGIEAADGASGLRLLQTLPRIDLLITDVGLPGGLNGRQVADAARTTRPDLKVLFITGYAENAAVGSGHLERGMRVVTKPFGMDDLANKIRSIMDR